MISVIIPVKDGGRDLRRCLDAIAAQEVAEEVEIVVVDSGSSDGSVEMASGTGARVEQIPSSAFNHGATRNYAASLARGDVLVFTSQDAYGASTEWLARLVAPLRSGDSYAGVYGRQLPHEDATPPERWFLNFLYGSDPRDQRLGDGGAVSMQTTLFSNVNSAIPRRLWELFPFADDLIMSEDQEWARRVLLAGHTLRYEPDAPVHHSHSYSLRAAFRRFFDSGVSSERAYLGAADAPAVLRDAARRYAVEELQWLWRTGQRRWIPYTALYELTKFAGLQLGAHHRLLPRGMKQRLSAAPGYWD